MTETTPYQLALVAGEAHDTASSLAASVADITPDADDVLSGFRRAGLTASDMRSRVVLCVPRNLPNLVELYSALCGFTGRFVDVSVDGTVVDVGDLYRRAVDCSDDGRPVERVDVLQIGGARNDMPCHTITELDPRGGVSPEVVTAIRYARRCRVVGTGDPVGDLIVFAITSGLRHRNGRDRFPQLVEGTEAADELDGVGVDLDGIRQLGMRYRRVARSYELVTVPVHGSSERQVQLERAAATPVRDLLIKLGSIEAGGLFSCPRPQNHTHGDATPSAKVYDDNRFRCHRCDAEPIDALRLVMQACGVTPDEAVMLLDDQSLLSEHRDRIVAERNTRSGTGSAPAAVEMPASAPADTTEHVVADTSGGEPVARTGPAGSLAGIFRS